MLRRHFGVSATEYLTEMPEWEADLLLTQVEPSAPVSVVPERDPRGAFAEAPSWLEEVE